MAKRSYKIPADLNQSYGDMEIALSNETVGLRPLPIKVIMTYVVAIVALFYICTQTFIASGTAVEIILFIVLWLILTAFLASYDKSKRMQIEFIPILLDYLPKASRNILTRKSASANGFYQICGIQSVEDENSRDAGLIHWTDDTWGYGFMVVGSASILLFDADRTAILDRVDSFYRKMNPEAEIIFVTDKEAQKVYNQINALQRRVDDLQKRDPDLIACADEQFCILKDYVGDQFKSIHQYMFIKADNKEVLKQACGILQSEVENSSLMIKQCVQLSYNDLMNLLHSIYSSTTKVHKRRKKTNATQSEKKAN